MLTKTASVTWLKDMTFVAQMGAHHLLVDSAPEGRASYGPSPMELALTSLATCTAMDVISILHKQRQPVTGLITRIEGERAADHPRRYTRVTVTFEVHGHALSRDAVERAVALSDEKYCSVTATFREPTEVVSRIEIVDDGPGGLNAP